jgi:hypothetical protein
MQAERLDNQIVGAQIQTANPGFDLLPTRKHQYRELWIDGTHFAEGLLPIHDRQIEIENGKIGHLFAEGADRLRPIGRASHTMAVSFHSASQEHSQRAVVFGDQHPHWFLPSRIAQDSVAAG